MTTLILTMVLVTCPNGECRTPVRTTLRVPVAIVVKTKEAQPVRRLGKAAIRPAKRVRQAIANRPKIARRIVKAAIR